MRMIPNVTLLPASSLEPLAAIATKPTSATPKKMTAIDTQWCLKS